ncbi:hypothetical protein TNCV_1648921 [Trichonephila clavipes]|uniref:Uncharacterized protein n=1 Tax=Trichonephila clavipes TaxID=2585209 RepID=A0A8X6V6L6_TRICX|nr:hypothetical protein TNCV_1648921 [Trichonephila clavipes]
MQDLDDQQSSEKDIVQSEDISNSHTPGLALHTTVAEKCPSSPEDQQKQGDSRDRQRKTLPPAQKSYYAGDRF